MSEIEFTVWEFVRVMVRLETTAASDPDGGQAALLAAWQEVWSELDTELARLGDADPEAMQALMLEHDLRVDCPAAMRAALGRTIGEVIAEMRTAMAGAGPDLRAALEVEAEAMDALHRRLGLGSV